MIIHSTSIEDLQQQITGEILTAQNAAYEAKRRGWKLSIDHHPALILVAKNAEDIAIGLRYAHEAGLGVAIQSTGHGILIPADDNLLILTSELKGVQVDAQSQTAIVQAGTVWQEVMDAAVPHGLAPLLGSSPHVGVIGYTLGGGFGWLGRKYGFAADSVLWIDLVTADGEIRHTSENENSDLFWGLRGGGGNFGVVTAMGFKLYPVKTLYGGNLVYSGADAAETLRFYRHWLKTIPDALTSSISVMKFPNLPFLPDAIRGQVQIHLKAAYSGSSSEGEAFIQKWLDWKAPLVNTFHEMPFSEIATISNDPENPTFAAFTNEMLDELSDAAIDTLLATMLQPSSALVMSELRHAGGAMTQPHNNAIGNREAQFYLTFGGPVFQPEDYPKRKASIDELQAAMRPHLRGGVYLNFMMGKAAELRAKDAYTPESFERLKQLKTKYDPENRFRFSYQIKSES